ncbi:hypothetical protein NC651_017465 [Populus alba x Populus x berolinensis]|nr:hypothetical protein NC651_017465 [Populus alba x Populus x berolinensis]
MASLVCWMCCWLTADSLVLAWLAATLPHDCMAHADGPSWVCMVKLRPAWFLRAAGSWWGRGSCLVFHLVSICWCRIGSACLTTCWQLLSGPPHCLAYPIDGEMCPSLYIMLAAALGVLILLASRCTALHGLPLLGSMLPFLVI